MLILENNRDFDEPSVKSAFALILSILVASSIPGDSSFCSNRREDFVVIVVHPAGRSDCGSRKGTVPFIKARRNNSARLYRFGRFSIVVIFSKN